MPIQRGEVYYLDLNPVKGREQAGTRPVLVLSINPINTLPLWWSRLLSERRERM
jgi:mRNA interferase MazF